MCYMCHLPVALATGSSVQGGIEKTGELACAESDELHSCRKPDCVRAK